MASSGSSGYCMRNSFVLLLCLAFVVIFALSSSTWIHHVQPCVRYSPRFAKGERRVAEVRHKNEEPLVENTADSNHKWIMSVKKRLFETRPNATSADTKRVSTDLPDCPKVPSKLVGKLKVNMTIPRLYEVYQTVTNVEQGGRWRPADCKARHRVAIIIPFRDREEHLNLLLRHLHPFLQKQKLDYGIFVAEPAGQQTFNKGTMMNIGFVEALKSYDFECAVFHDVDLLPENDKISYACPQYKVKHMCVAIDKFNYAVADKPYPYFGGVVQATKNATFIVNGFTNEFVGWGGEDDEMQHRVTRTVGFYRNSSDIMRYKMIRHERDKKNPPNEKRWDQLAKVKSRKDSFWEKDGLTTVNYVVLEKEKRRLYTWILAEVFKPRPG